MTTYTVFPDASSQKASSTNNVAVVVAIDDSELIIANIVYGALMPHLPAIRAFLLRLSCNQKLDLDVFLRCTILHDEICIVCRPGTCPFNNTMGGV